MQKQFNRGREATNADRIIGHVGVVQETIDNREAVGLVKVDGTLWSARSLTDQPIPAGAEVVIRSIEGGQVPVAAARCGRAGSRVPVLSSGAKNRMNGFGVRLKRRKASSG